MRADQFYTTQANQAVPLFFLSKEHWQEKRISLTPREHNLFVAQQFSGGLGDICCLYNDEGQISKAYVGCGETDCQQGLVYAATKLPPGNYEFQEALSTEAMIAWSLAQYCFSEYKKKQTTQLRVLIVNKVDLASVVAQAEAIFLVRDLINKSPNDLDPEELSRVLANLAANYSASFEQWVGEELLTHNYPAIYAVGAAAAATPRLLSLCWGNQNDPRISLIGKGVCFDSGGLDLKPAPHMRFMKKDMGGAAHVIGLAQWIMSKNLPVYLEVLIPALENAIGSQAFRPGDVLTMRNGLTVEVDNTDAEGRLVMADALVKACEKKPALIIDFATLTGAARVAVGTEIAAMFSNDDQLAQSLMSSAKLTKDPIWRLPLFSGYESMLDSVVADLSNCSPSPYGGAISAALFLQRFMSPEIPWIHFDIMAWNLSSKPGKPEGGEAMGLRAIMHYLMQAYGKA